MRAKDRKLVFEFAREASKIYEHIWIFLYGSIPRGDADKRSDIDLMVVFDTDQKPEQLKEKSKISNLALDLEKKYDRNIQIVFSNKNLEGLDEYFIRQVLGEGILLYGKPSIKVVGEKKLLQPHSLIIYNLQNLDRSGKMRVRKELSGYKVSKEYRGRVYTSQSNGLIKDLGGRKLGYCTILISQQKSKILKQKLDKLKVKYKERIIWTTTPTY